VLDRSGTQLPSRTESRRRCGPPSLRTTRLQCPDTVATLSVTAPSSSIVVDLLEVRRSIAVASRAGRASARLAASGGCSARVGLRGPGHELGTVALERGQHLRRRREAVQQKDRAAKRAGTARSTGLPGRVGRGCPKVRLNLIPETHRPALRRAAISSRPDLSGESFGARNQIVNLQVDAEKMRPPSVPGYTSPYPTVGAVEVEASGRSLDRRAVPA
jgi:hypothetical protein